MPKIAVIDTFWGGFIIPFPSRHKWNIVFKGRNPKASNLLTLEPKQISDFELEFDRSKKTEYFRLLRAAIIEPRHIARNGQTEPYRPSVGLSSSRFMSNYADKV